MFDKFTERARRLFSLARAAAVRFGHDHIGTEHVLLGLAQVGSGVAVEALRLLGASLERIRSETEMRLAGKAAGQETPPYVPFTAEVKRVLELTVEEALGLGHSYLGTEHLLLALLRRPECAAAQVLAGLGVDVDSARRAVHTAHGVSGPCVPPGGVGPVPPIQGGLVEPADETWKSVTAAAMDSVCETILDLSRVLGRLHAALTLAGIAGGDAREGPLADDLQEIVRRLRDRSVEEPDT